MARKAKKHSCQVKHWWEARGSARKGEGKWQSHTDEDVRFVMRHLIESHHLGRKAKPEDLLRLSQPVFYRIGLGRMVKKFGGSTSAILRHAYPEFFDWSRRNHLHEWDLSMRGRWGNAASDDLARVATRHMLEQHHLGRPASLKDVQGFDHGLLEALGLRRIAAGKFGGSPAATIRHAYFEFFDLSRQQHLHVWDFPQHGIWHGKSSNELAREAIRHMLETHHLRRPLRPSDLQHITGDTFEALGFRGVIAVKFRGSAQAALRHAYLEFFDTSRPDHLHEWDLARRPGRWQGRTGDNLARAAIRHMLEEHCLGRPATREDLVGADKNKAQLLERLGLTGMLRTKFAGSPIAALRHAYPEFAEALGSRIKGTADFVEVLEAEDPKRAPKLLKDLMSHFSDDLVDVADILAVVYAGRLDSSTAMEILQDPTMRPWIVPFDGKGHGPGKPPIGDDFPFYLLEKDRNGVIAGIIRRRLTEWRRKVLGARPSQETRAKFLLRLRTLQEKFRTNGGNEVTPAAA